MDKNKESTGNEIHDFYNNVYYKDIPSITHTNRHLRALVQRIGVKKGDQVLDVACGSGAWLLACTEVGAVPSGVDLSEKAIAACQNSMTGEFYATPAEKLPFDDGKFDIVTCLGSLEHFLDPVSALKEMVRVAKPNATFLILVPNADFLTRKLGLFAGTYQVDAKEEVRTLDEWKRLFQLADLNVEDRWKDLHVVSRSWIFSSSLLAVPFRFMQALALIVWPLKWQYQVYHLLRLSEPTFQKRNS